MKYTKAEAKVVLFDNSDVVTTSFNIDAMFGDCEQSSVAKNSDCGWDSITGCGYNSYKN